MFEHGAVIKRGKKSLNFSLSSVFKVLVTACAPFSDGILS